MIIVHKVLTGLIISSSIFILSSAVRPVANTISSINAGRYIALPESMAWQCVDTIRNLHGKRIRQVNKINVDPVIKRLMIDFEQADYERDLKASCGIADLSELPPRETLMEIKP